MTVTPAEQSAELSIFAGASRAAPTEPYRGLEPLRFTDAGILAAREPEIERLVRLVTMYRGVLLYGESGSGKSSVVNAGLLPRLLEEQVWPHRVRVQPRAGEEFVLEPIRSSAADRDAYLPSAFGGAAPDGRLVLAAEAFVAAVTAAAEKGRVLLVFDQFEELVTLFEEAADGGDAQPRVVDAIIRLLRGRDVPVKILFVFREDYLANLEPLLAEQPELADQSVRLVPPPVGAAVQIIRAPFVRFAKAYRRELSAELADRISASLEERSQSGRLNLSELQIVCVRLWHAQDPAALLDSRGVWGLLEDFLDERLSAFEGSFRDLAIVLLTRLVTSSGTRNVVSRDDLLAEAIEEQDATPTSPTRRSSAWSARPVSYEPTPTRCHDLRDRQRVPRPRSLSSRPSGDRSRGAARPCGSDETARAGTRRPQAHPPPHQRDCGCGRRGGRGPARCVRLAAETARGHGRKGGRSARARRLGRGRRGGRPTPRGRTGT